MTDLESILKNPRTHRAVPETEMVGRVRTSAMQAWKAEQVESARETAIAAQDQGAVKTKRRRVTPLHVVAFGLAVAGVLVLLSPHVQQMPRYDLLLKYGLYDLIDATALGMLYHPLQTALLLAAMAAALGFGLSSQARTALRRMF